MKELNYATTRKHYFGRKAVDYDLGRETSVKWQNEQSAISRGLRGVSGIVLDIPCGTGRYFGIYRHYGLEFIGMDVSEDMMVQARTKNKDADVRHGDIMDIPLKENTVDYSVCTRMLNFFSEAEMKSAVAELCRVTSKEALVGAFTAEKAERRNRCNVHPISAFVAAFDSAGYDITDGYEIRRPDYMVYRCVSR